MKETDSDKTNLKRLKKSKETSSHGTTNC